jgi:hypothetical protein
MRSTNDLELCALLSLAVIFASCATPSRREMDEKDAEVKRMMTAHAVHLPKGVDPCVGVTMRLSDPNANAESVAERDKMAALISKAEVDGALDGAGVATCREIYLDAVSKGSIAPEPFEITMSFGVDPDGRVCAVVEKKRNDPIDPNAVGIVEESAACLKEALFRADLPKGRVKDRERIVLTYHLVADPVQEIKKASEGSSAKRP